MKIRELLDCYDDKIDNMNDLLSRFSQGKSIDSKNSDNGIPRESKRAIKERKAIEVVPSSPRKRRVVKKGKKVKLDESASPNKSFSNTNNKSRNTGAQSGMSWMVGNLDSPRMQKNKSTLSK